MELGLAIGLSLGSVVKTVLGEPVTPPPTPEWITDPPVIPNGEIDVAFEYNLNVDLNTTAGVVITVSAGSLPSGLSIVGTSIIGTPDTAETQAAIQLTATNVTGVDESAAFSIKITNANVSDAEITGTNSEGSGVGPIEFTINAAPDIGDQWPEQDAWIGNIPSIRDRNGVSAAIVAAGRGFGAGGPDGGNGRNAYSAFNIGTQIGTRPTIIHVTTRTDNVSGSLREAWEHSDDRVVVFDVYGRFEISGTSMNMNNPNCFIAGSSAGGEILIVNVTPGKNIRIQANNVLVQDVIIWDEALPEFPGFDAGNNDNALIISGNGSVKSNICLSNVTLGGGTDQVLLVFDDIDYITLMDTFICCPRGKNPEEVSAPGGEFDGINGHQYSYNIGGPGQDVNHCSLINVLSMDGEERNPSWVPEIGGIYNCTNFNFDTKSLDVRGNTAQTLVASFNCVSLYNWVGPAGDAFPINLGRSNGAQSFGSGTEIFISQTIASQYVSDEWDVVKDNDSQEGAVRVDTIISAAVPTGLVTVNARNAVLSEYKLLVTRNLGSRPANRNTQIAGLIDGMVAGTHPGLQTDYATPTVTNGSATYIEPAVGNANHEEGVAAGWSVLLEDLADKHEALLV